MLVPIDSLEILAIVDNELDPISPAPPIVSVSGRLGDLGLGKGRDVGGERGGVEGAPMGREMVKEIEMEQICCGAHGLSLFLTAKQGDQTSTLLFDTGPTESIFTSNTKRLAPALKNVSRIHLSHWHRDHSGGMLAAVKMIQDAKSNSNHASKGKGEDVVVDLHPNRPVYRGVATPMGTLSLEADPSFEEIERAGGVVEKSDQAHEVLENRFLISGEIPRVTEYEHGIKWGVRFVEGEWVPDELVMDERFVVCHVKDKGLVLFTGCSHAGVVNCAKHALELVGHSIPLYAIVGGYHLADAPEEQTKATVKDLKELGVKVLMAGHCTGWRAKFEIERQMEGALVPSFVGIKTVI